MKELINYVTEQFNTKEPVKFHFKDELKTCINDFLALHVDSHIVNSKFVNKVTCSSYTADKYSTYIKGNEFELQGYIPGSEYDKVTLGVIKFKVKEVNARKVVYWRESDGRTLTDIAVYVDGNEFNGTIEEFAVIANKKLAEASERYQLDNDKKIKETTEIVNKLKSVFPEIKNYYDIQNIVRKLDFRLVNKILSE